MSVLAMISSNTNTRRALSDVSHRINANLTNTINGKSAGKSSILNADACAFTCETNTLSVNRPSISPEPTPSDATPFKATPTTCVPSYLAYLGMSQYAADFMERGVYNLGQLYALTRDQIRTVVTCDEHCSSVYDGVHGIAATTSTHACSISLSRTSSSRSLGRVLSVRRNDPYAFNCILSDDVESESSEVAVPLLENPSMTLSDIIPNDSFVNEHYPAQTAQQSTPCSCMVRFEFRQAEFESAFLVRPGQYVMVSGDRGQDIGLVLRVNTDSEKGYVERTGPQGKVLRLAYQKEVDYASGPLRAEAAAATEVCRGKVNRLGLTMEVCAAEYQYDKKKLTFYYESRSRVDFVTLLKEMYREFGCRIWMEKMPRNNGTTTTGDADEESE